MSAKFSRGGSKPILSHPSSMYGSDQELLVPKSSTLPLSQCIMGKSGMIGEFGYCHILEHIELPARWITKTRANAHLSIQQVFSWYPLGGSQVSPKLQKGAITHRASYLQVDERRTVAQLVVLDWGLKGC